MKTTTTNNISLTNTTGTKGNYTTPYTTMSSPQQVPSNSWGNNYPNGTNTGTIWGGNYNNYQQYYTYPNTTELLNVYTDSLEHLEYIDISHIEVEEKVGEDLKLKACIKSNLKFNCILDNLKELRILLSMNTAFDYSANEEKAIFADVYIVEAVSNKRYIGKGSVYNTHECSMVEFKVNKHISIKDEYNKGDMEIENLLKKVKRDYIIDSI